MNKDNKTYYLNGTKAIFRDDGIVVMVFDDNLWVKKEHIAELNNCIANKTGGKKTLRIADISGIQYSDRASRQYASSEEVAATVEAVALIVGSNLSRIIGNFFINLSQPPYPTKLFDNYDDAVEWLHKIQSHDTRKIEHAQYKATFESLSKKETKKLKHTLFNTVCISHAILVLIVAIIFTTMGVQLLPYILVPFAILSFTFVPISKRNISLAGNLYLLLNIVTVSSAIFLTGGLSGPAAPALFLLPLLVVLFSQSKSMVLWFGSLVAILVTLTIMQFSDLIKPAQEAMLANSAPTDTIIIIGIAIQISIFAIFQFRFKKQNIDTLKRNEQQTYDFALNATEILLQFSHQNFDTQLEAPQENWALNSLALGINGLGKELKDARDALLQSQQQLNIITDSIPAFIAYIDADLRYRFVNKTYETSLKTHRDKITGKRIDQIVDKKALEIFRPHFEKALSGEPASFESVSQPPEGNPRHLFTRFHPDKDHSGNVHGFFAITIDMTSEKETAQKLEETEKRLLHSTKIHQTAKLATLGTLAASIVHEINQPLAAIEGYTQILKSSKDLVEADRKQAKLIHNAAVKMSKVVKHLKEFSSERKNDDWKPFNLNDAINESLTLLSTRLKNQAIELQLRLDPNIKPIIGDCVLLESVFQNLITNSCDAFEELEDSRPKFITIENSNTDTGCKVIYTDNAGGMTHEVVGRIFERFYTTKSAGRGTGLGLSIVNNIVKDHSGSLKVNSKPGEGTQFVLEFPEAHSQSQFPQDTSSDIHPSTQHNLEPSVTNPRLLIIDDDPNVVDILAAYLSEQFSVTSCDNPSHSGDLIRNSQWDLILTDLNMPHFTGEQVIKVVHEHHPTTPVVLISGQSSNTPLVKRCLELGAIKVISKPFPRPDELNAMLKEVLSSRKKSA